MQNVGEHREQEHGWIMDGCAEVEPVNRAMEGN